MPNPEANRPNRGNVVCIEAHRTRYVQTRNALVEQHLPLVRQIARSIAQRLPPCFDPEDLIATGNLALIRAADRYRPAEHAGAPFAAFARPVVRGAILDSINRRHYMEQTRPALEDVSEPAATHHTAEVIETTIDHGRLRRALAHEVAYLTPDQQAVLAICYGPAERPSLADAAAHLGITYWAARQLRDAALATLRMSRRIAL